ncbi:LysR substrate-binding domain-containing protein [Vibrio kyushuensis]|uniref:LysR substrate-binding domain-containing protein n=1 Tax=Vibrio kyushuensis TaxID=2910249 RepID=UPI003D145406
MKLTQLKYLTAIAKHDFNISIAARELFTSQPGISKQIGLLESELGLKIFERKGRSLTGITPVGLEIIKEAQQMLLTADRIKAIASNYANPNKGSLNIYTTNTIARFILPETIRYFFKKYPHVPFHVGAAHPTENGLISKIGPSDFSIVAHKVESSINLITLPAYNWSLSLIIPKDHDLSSGVLSLERLAKYRLISYDKGSSGRYVQDKAFGSAGLYPKYAMTVMDTDVIKKYVGMGLGVGVIATIAAESICDDEIVAIPLKGLIDSGSAWLCFSRGVYLQDHMYDFIEKFAPHLTKVVMERVVSMSSNDLAAFSKTFELPQY